MKKTKRFTEILLMTTVAIGGCGGSGVSQEEYGNEDDKWLNEMFE